MSYVRTTDFGVGRDGSDLVPRIPLWLASVASGQLQILAGGLCLMSSN